MGDVLEDDHEIAKEVEGKMNQKFETMQQATVSSIKDMLQKEISQMKDTLMNEEKLQIQKLVRQNFERFSLLIF